MVNSMIEGNKVEISLVYKDEDDFKIEKVFAERIGNYYQLKAVPAFAQNLAYNDIISAEKDGDDLFFDSLIQQSGHSVVQVVILTPENSANILARLISLDIG